MTSTSELMSRAELVDSGVDLELVGLIIEAHDEARAAGFVTGTSNWGAVIAKRITDTAQTNRVVEHLKKYQAITQLKIGNSPYGEKTSQPSEVKPIGYHIQPIARGVFGEISKIVEEVHELEDAEAQGIQVMVLAELSDIIGAMQGYLAKYHPSIKLNDLAQMAKVTQRAFDSGSRKARS